MAETARGLGVAAGLDESLAGELARECAGLGYASMWSNDHPMASGLETAATFARATGLDVGVAVLALDRHSPADVASKITEVGLDPARLWVGIGAGFSKRPLAVMREGLAAMREALPDTARLVVAAMGPKMCELAGAEADGVFLNWMTPEKAAWARERVQAGSQATGRDRPTTIFGYVRVAIGDDAPERLLKEESFYRQLHDGYIRHFETLERAPGTVGVAAFDAQAARSALAEYEPAIDHIVVRALGSATLEGLGAVARAAAPRGQ